MLRQWHGLINIFMLEIQFLNNVIIIKTKINLPE